MNLFRKIWKIRKTLKKSKIPTNKNNRSTVSSNKNPQNKKPNYTNNINNMKQKINKNKSSIVSRNYTNNNNMKQKINKNKSSIVSPNNPNNYYSNKNSSNNSSKNNSTLKNTRNININNEESGNAKSNNTVKTLNNPPNIPCSSIFSIVEPHDHVEILYGDYAKQTGKVVGSRTIWRKTKDKDKRIYRSNMNTYGILKQDKSHCEYKVKLHDTQKVVQLHKDLLKKIAPPIDELMKDLNTILTKDNFDSKKVSDMLHSIRNSLRVSNNNCFLNESGKELVDTLNKSCIGKSAEQKKQIWKQMSLFLHPDKNTSCKQEATIKFQEYMNKPKNICYEEVNN